MDDNNENKDVESQQEYQTEQKDEGPMTALLTWKDLKLTVDGRRYILQGLTGCAEPGQLLAIMGPSGSGKSTLLDTLSGRPSPDASVTGDILVNGRKVNLAYGSGAAYLAQDVLLLGTLTVYETLYYSAKLRFKDGTSASETKRRVMNAVEDVGLVDALNTPIGNWYQRGISGGEKRRVSIAIELLTAPMLIFLDEPTSGLDSASSFHVIKTLKDLAQDGNRTILCSIHQPASEVFELFDDLCLLSDGKQIYFGPLPGAQNFFDRNGCPCPRFRSPADHYLHCVNSDFDNVVKILERQESTARSGRRPPLPSGQRQPQRTAKQTVEQLTTAFKLSEEKRTVEERVALVSQVQPGREFTGKGSEAGLFKQATYLTVRSFLNMHRDIGYYWVRSAVYLAICVCLGTVFRDIGNEYDSIQARASAFTFVVGFLSFMAIGGFPSFIEDMKVFQTERMNGHYSVGAFVVGNALSSMPFIFFISCFSTAVVYPLIKLHSGFVEVVYFILVLYGCLLVSESLMMMVSSMVTQFILGIMLGAGVQGIFLLISGFFRLPDDLPQPVWKYPMFYISYPMYGFQGLMQSEFKGKTFRPFLPGNPLITSSYVLREMYDIDMSRSKWWNAAVVFFMVLAYRLLFYTLLKSREGLFPAIAIYVKKRWQRLASRRYLLPSDTSASE